MSHLIGGERIRETEGMTVGDKELPSVQNGYYLAVSM